MNTQCKTSTKSNRTASGALGDRNAKKAAPIEKRAVKERTTTPTAKSVAPNSATAGFPIVGIGASADGLEAMEELLANMPTDTGMAFVVVTHQHPGHTSLLPELLAKETKMPVAQAVDGMTLEPNHVYVGAPGEHLAILNGTLHRMEIETFRRRPKQVIDTPLFELGDGAWDIPELHELLETILSENATFENFEVDQEFGKIGRKIFLLNARRLEREQGLPDMILLGLEDITEKYAA